MAGSSEQGDAPIRRLVLVVGVSPTAASFLAGLLGRLGFHVPQPGAEATDSDRSFGEPRWVAHFHRRLMRKQRVTAFDARPEVWESTVDAANDEDTLKKLRSWLAVQFVGAENVVVKDPRLAWFLSLWRRAAGDLGIEISIVSALRDPSELLSSAGTWYGKKNDASRTAGWLNVTLHAEEATRGARRAFVRYERLLEDWPREISRLGEALDIPWMVGIERSQYPSIDALVDRRLQRPTVAWSNDTVPSALQTMVDDVWTRMLALADTGEDNDDVRGALDAARAAYAQLYAEAAAIAQSSIRAGKPQRLRERRPAAPRKGRGGRRTRSAAPRAMQRIRRRVPLRLRRAALRVGRRVVGAPRRHVDVQPSKRARPAESPPESGGPRRRTRQGAAQTTANQHPLMRSEPRRRGVLTRAALRVRDRGAPRSAAPSVRPRTAILVVNGFDRRGRWGNYNVREARRFPWIGLCLQQLERHTAELPYHVLVWDNTFLPEHLEILEANPNVSVFSKRETRTPVWHPYALDRLLCEVPAETEFIVTLDTDSFPIRDAWLGNLIGRLDGGALIAGVWRDEMRQRLHPFIHPSCLAVRRDTLLELDADFSRNRGQDAGQNITKAVTSAGGRISRLRRSNALDVHFLMGGVYGDLVYHQGAGSRNAEFWTSSDTRADEAIRVALRDAAFKDLDRLVAVLTGDMALEDAPDLGLEATAGEPLQRSSVADSGQLLAQPTSG